MQEDLLLLKLYKKYSTDWKLINKWFPDKTLVGIKKRWNDKLNPEIRVSPWTDEEDEKIVELFRKYGGKWA